MEDVIASLPETPPLLLATVATMLTTQVFVGSIGSGFGGGDRQPVLSLNNDYVVFDIGRD